MKRMLAAAIVVASVALCGPANALPWSPGLADRPVADTGEAAVSKVHHKPGHIGGRGKHKGWYKPNRGKHKGWRKFRR